MRTLLRGTVSRHFKPDRRDKQRGRKVESKRSLRVSRPILLRNHAVQRNRKITQTIRDIKNVAVGKQLSLFKSQENNKNILLPPCQFEKCKMASATPMLYISSHVRKPVWALLISPKSRRRILCSIIVSIRHPSKILAIGPLCTAKSTTTHKY